MYKYNQVLLCLNSYGIPKNKKNKTTHYAIHKTSDFYNISTIYTYIHMQQITISISLNINSINFIIIIALILICI